LNTRITNLVRSIVLAAACVAAAPGLASDYSGLIVFGDSMSDTGNLLALTGGVNPADPPYWQGRYSNGNVWPEFMSETATLPLKNFAHGSALTGYDNLDGPYPGLLTEIDDYVAANPAGTDPDALYVIWAGANDFFALGDASGADAATDVAVNNITTAVLRLVQLGARHILVGDLPDLGLIPYADGPSALVPPALLTTGSAEFNRRLILSLSNTGFPVRLMDIFDLTQRVAADPAAYGFGNAEDRCLSRRGVPCAEPDTYLYWDDRHPTTAGHRVLASHVESISGTLNRSRSTPGVFNPNTAMFRLYSAAADEPPTFRFRYGQAGWVPLAGDWNGDGIDTVGLFNTTTSRFFLRNENSTGPTSLAFTFGQANWVPLTGDWNGDGTDTVGVYNPNTGRFFLRNSNSTGANDITFRFEQAGLIPIAGDWDGDGIDSIGVYDPNTTRFALRDSNSAGPASYMFVVGQPGRIPVMGDWDRNGTDTAGVYNPATGQFALRNIHFGGPPDVVAQLGPPGQLPIAGDWDGPDFP